MEVARANLRQSALCSLRIRHAFFFFLIVFVPLYGLASGVHVF